MDHSSHLHLFKVLPLSTPLDACPVDPGRGPIAQGLMATLLVTRAREVPPRKARQGPRNPQQASAQIRQDFRRGPPQKAIRNAAPSPGPCLDASFLRRNGLRNAESGQIGIQRNREPIPSGRTLTTLSLHILLSGVGLHYCTDVLLIPNT